jgi:uncharacterized protein (TIGR03437 family)
VFFDRRSCMNHSPSLASARRGFRNYAFLLLAAAASNAMGQQVAVSIGSGSTSPGGTLSLNISLATSGGLGPSSVQWTLTYSAATVTGVSIVVGSAASGAAKTATCSSTGGAATCVVSGMNQTIIPNGTLAIATFTVSPNAVTSSQIQVSTVASSPAGAAIPSSGTAGTISISGTQPGVSGLTCVATAVNAPGNTACTVSLSAPSPVGGMTVALAINNSNVTVPASVNVPSGAASTGFTASVASVSTVQTATLTASMGATSRAVLLNLTPAPWSISGSVTPSLSGAGTTLALSGGTTTNADSSGKFTFTGLVNGTYTLTPSKTGYTFNPASQSVTLNGASLTSINFTGAPSSNSGPITIDAQVRQDQSTASSAITSPAFSTTSNGELLLAFISTGFASGDSASVIKVSGGDLAWALVVRTQAQKGTAEIWRAFSPMAHNGISVSAILSATVTSSMTVMAFAGVDSSGSDGSGAIGAVASGSQSSGAPSASLVSTRPNSFIAGVGNDPKAAVARIPGSGQNLVHQFLDPAGRTYWVQTSSSLTLPSGTNFVINDSAPANDPYNLSIAEILARPPTTTSSLAAPSSGGDSPQLSQVPPVLSSLNGVSDTNACSPGRQVLLTGIGFTSQAPQQASGNPLPTELAGVQVIVNGVAAPLLSAAESRLIFQCPSLDPGTPLHIAVQGPSGPAIPLAETVMTAASPELFTLATSQGDATNQGVILLGATDQIAMTANTNVPSRPAIAGESLTIYAIGLGEVASGTASQSDSPALLKNQIRVVIGGTEIAPGSVVLAPGALGLFQIDLQLPQEVPSGSAIPLFLKAILPDGTTIESNEVTLAIDDPSSAR